VDVDKAARFLALHRSPKESEKWATRNLRPRSTSPPIFEPREDNALEETRGKDGFSGSQYYERMMSQPSRRSPLPPTQKPPQPTKKRSIFDEQPDARRIYFDSREPSPIPQSAQPPPPPRQLQRDTPPPVPPPRKRVKTQRPPAPADDDEEDFQNSPPPPNQERLKQSRVSASARRPPVSQAPPTRRTIADQILDRIHGPAPPPPAMGGHEPVRKGRGWEWTLEQEMFLVEQIGQYGPAWADIARHHCQRGGKLEGRDQAKLKDKARNIKEKYIRYFPSPHYAAGSGGLKANGVGREERCRRILQWLRHSGILRRRRLRWKLWLLIGRDFENYVSDVFDGWLDVPSP